MDLGNLLRPIDEVAVFLTIHGLRPATQVRIEAEYNSIKDPPDEYRRMIGTKRHVSFRVNSKALQFLKDQLANNHTPTRYSEEVKVLTHKPGVVQIKYTSVFCVGSTQENLDRLKRALTTLETEAQGIAFGYPTAAIQLFESRWNQSYRAQCITKAQKAGVEIPSWLAYTSFTPAQLDIVNGNIDEESMRLGKSYEEFVKTHNPNLAAKVERQFSHDCAWLADKSKGGIVYAIGYYMAR